MRTRLGVLLILVASALLGGCPDEREETIDKIGGAPKRQLDHVQQALDEAAKKNAARLENTGDTE